MTERESNAGHTVSHKPPKHNPTRVNQDKVNPNLQRKNYTTQHIGTACKVRVCLLVVHTLTSVLTLNTGAMTVISLSCY